MAKQQIFFRILKDYDSEKESTLVAQFKARNVTFIILGYSFFIALLSFLVLSLTPLKELLPGYPDQEISIQHIENQNTIEELKRKNQLNRQYLNAISSILNGEITAIQELNIDEQVFQKPSIGGLDATENELEFRSDIEQEDALNVQKHIDHKTNLNFYKPIEGLVTDRFNPQANHFGVDIVSTQDEPIKAIQTGTVLYAGWTSEDGYVVVIQHAENVTSIYKNNSSVLKRVGDPVLVGEVIAVVGRSSLRHQGEHLHLEIWKNGYAVDPEKVINF
ncbi:MAG: M23 family metallopeptidase [Flavobacteriales bacterium]